MAQAILPQVPRQASSKFCQHRFPRLPIMESHCASRCFRLLFSMMVCTAAIDKVCVANQSADEAVVGNAIGYACGKMPRFNCSRDIPQACDAHHADVYTLADFVFS